MVHRDLKPENILINEDIKIKIGGFGISKLLDSYKTYVKTTAKAGDDYYITPEIIDDGI